MIRALLLCLIATPCMAERHEWGTPAPSIVETHPGEGSGHVATVSFLNRRTATSLGTFGFSLTEGGVSLAITVAQGLGDALDRMTVAPPDGYVAIPQFVDVEENASGSIEIFEAEGVPMS